MTTLQHIIHYFLHLGLPCILVFYFYKTNWKIAIFKLWATMLIDIDHLWVEPIYDSCRCSLGNHTLHSFPFLLLYPILIFYRKTRLIGVGLLLHMITDGIDCLFILKNCN